MRRPLPSVSLVGEVLEDRLAPAVVDLTAPEQYLLELMNRARANPTAEAARYGISLNEGLAPGTISDAALPPLAPSAELAASIRGHLQDLISTGTFSHTGSNGSTTGQRITAAGYRWTTYGENLAVGTATPVSRQTAEETFALWFIDAGIGGRLHRLSILSPDFREIGVSMVSGAYQGRTTTYAGIDFGTRSTTPILTGVVYTDQVVRDNFYTVGEGIASATITAKRTDGTTFQTTSGTAGGYALEVQPGTYTVSVTTSGGLSDSQTVTVSSANVKVDSIPTSRSVTPTLPPPVVVPITPIPTAKAQAPSQYAVGTDAGVEGRVLVYNADGSSRAILTPFPGFTGGVRVAAADFTGDGVADIVAGTGPGSTTRVNVYDGATQALLFSTAPFETAFTGGVYVAAGDITGDGKAELIITPDEGGGPRVRVFSAIGFLQLADFLGIEDTNFRGGARAAVGDLNADGRGDLVVAAGFGGGPRIAAFDGSRLGSSGGLKLFGDFLAFEDTLRNGTYIAVGDVDGDGFADLVAGGGPGGGPRVSVFDGRNLLNGTRIRDADFFAGNVSDRGGVRPAVKNLDNDHFADVLTGSGVGSGARITTYAGNRLSGSNPPTLSAFSAVSGFNGGVFVG